ncbi:MAG: ATP-binding cassette domain-containing protein, partial [Xanthomonadales bacterium]|nr:ATP-binding cassette domain-containing protein [Xanthomonadales bacterium]
MIKATNISKNFGSIKILKNIDIEINTSEITVIIGPSGSGKTTL